MLSERLRHPARHRPPHLNCWRQMRWVPGAKICGHELHSTTEGTKPRRLSMGTKNAAAGRRIRGNAYTAALCFGLEPIPTPISHSLIVGPRGLGRRKGRRENRPRLIPQLSCGRPGRHRLYECIALKNHLFADSRCPELLEGLDCTRVKVIPCRKGPDELHEGKRADELGPAGCQMKCQRSSPVLRYHEC